MTKAPKPICPTCGAPARRIQTVYGSKYQCCGLWSWGRKPLVSALTHERRKHAHAVFDPLWREGHMARPAAYARLAELLGLEPRECHMSLMDAETAGRVPAAVEIMRSELETPR